MKSGPKTLRLFPLGEFRVEWGDRLLPADRWRSRKAETLLKLLVLSPGHAMPKEAVKEALWPELDPPAALNNLHKSLFHLRRTLDVGAAEWMDRLIRIRLRRPPGGLWKTGTRRQSSQQ